MTCLFALQTSEFYRILQWNHFETRHWNSEGIHFKNHFRFLHWNPVVKKYSPLNSIGRPISKQPIHRARPVITSLPFVKFSLQLSTLGNLLPTKTEQEWRCQDEGTGQEMLVLLGMESQFASRHTTGGECNLLSFAGNYEPISWSCLWDPHS